jgi:hypothetical protein
MVGSVVLFALVAAVAFEISIGSDNYGTDAIAFAHAGGEILLEGGNPYDVSPDAVGDALDRFGVPESFVTRTNRGQVVDQLISYPAGHVLAYSGALAIGLTDLRWATLVFEVAALSVIWIALSPTARFIVPMVLLVEPNLTVNFTTGGLTDWLWVLPLAVCAIFLHRRKFAFAGLALGIACAIKQQPWFVVPFVLAWVVLKTSAGDGESRRPNRLGFIGGLIGGFVLLNLPFMIWSPGDWAEGILNPILSDLVPDGQGLSAFASRGILALTPRAFLLTMAAALAVSLVVYVFQFDRLQDLLWVLPPVVLFFSYRSFHSYFVYWVPVAVLWLDLRSRDPALPITGPKPKARLSVGSALLLFLSVAGLALGTAMNRDQLEVGRVEPVVESGVITAIDVQLTNPGTSPVEPVFDVYWGGWPVPWSVDRGIAIGPGRTSSVRIFPPGPESIPPLRLNSRGIRESLPFRVRVNEKGEDVYSASSLVQILASTDPIVNPGFVLWNSSDVNNRRPYGWATARQAPLSGQANLAPIGGGRGVVTLIHNQATPGSQWAEVSLLQEVGSLQGCYRMSFRYSDAYAVDAFGSPTRAVGLQVAQSGKALWLVASDSAEAAPNSLADGTRVIEIPAERSTWNDVVLDLRPHVDELGMQLGRRATIKIFNALHQSQRGPQELQVSEIIASECPGGLWLQRGLLGQDKGQLRAIG